MNLPSKRSNDREDGTRSMGKVSIGKALGDAEIDPPKRGRGRPRKSSFPEKVGIKETRDCPEEPLKCDRVLRSSAHKIAVIKKIVDSDPKPRKTGKRRLPESVSRANINISKEVKTGTKEQKLRRSSRSKSAILEKTAVEKKVDNASKPQKRSRGRASERSISRSITVQKGADRNSKLPKRTSNRIAQLSVPEKIVMEKEVNAPKKRAKSCTPKNLVSVEKEAKNDKKPQRRGRNCAPKHHVPDSNEDTSKKVTKKKIEVHKDEKRPRNGRSRSAKSSISKSVTVNKGADRDSKLPKRASRRIAQISVPRKKTASEKEVQTLTKPDKSCVPENLVSVEKEADNDKIPSKCGEGRPSELPISGSVTIKKEVDKDLIPLKRASSRISQPSGPERIASEKEINVPNKRARSCTPENLVPVEREADNDKKLSKSGEFCAPEQRSSEERAVENHFETVTEPEKLGREEVSTKKEVVAETKPKLAKSCAPESSVFEGTVGRKDVDKDVKPKISDKGLSSTQPISDSVTTKKKVDDDLNLPRSAVSRISKGSEPGEKIVIKKEVKNSEKRVESCASASLVSVVKEEGNHQKSRKRGRDCAPEHRISENETSEKTGDTKRQKLAQDIQSESSISKKVAVKKEVANDPKPQKRGRGHPSKRSVSVQKEVDVDSKLPKQANNLVSQLPVPEKTVVEKEVATEEKPTIRPKSSAPEHFISEENALENVFDPFTEPKKVGRGRPKKDKATKKEVVAEKKTKLGRACAPKNFIFEEIDSEKDLESVAKPGKLRRGRPPKNATFEKPLKKAVKESKRAEKKTEKTNIQFLSEEVEVLDDVDEGVSLLLPCDFARLKSLWTAMVSECDGDVVERYYFLAKSLLLGRISSYQPLDVLLHDFPLQIKESHLEFFSCLSQISGVFQHEYHNKSALISRHIVPGVKELYALLLLRSLLRNVRLAYSVEGHEAAYQISSIIRTCLKDEVDGALERQTETRGNGETRLLKLQHFKLPVLTELFPKE
ncbi:unnamed protein product [Caenorhabditis auriculariae]|uniref:Uncharacterized protein n=1 Tax=Caenorhabditis auriculariae TaxID=2777116 RepID=A0A8S1GSA8_9PELO|nr:unnamed protein product [Caenorhabditis auriculariae]